MVFSKMIIVIIVLIFMKTKMMALNYFSFVRDWAAWTPQFVYAITQE